MVGDLSQLVHQVCGPILADDCGSSSYLQTTQRLAQNVARHQCGRIVLVYTEIALRLIPLDVADPQLDRSVRIFQGYPNRLI